MKKRRNRRPNNLGMAATTTSKDWGFIPIPGKGGKTTNCHSTCEKYLTQKAEWDETREQIAK